MKSNNTPEVSVEEIIRRLNLLERWFPVNFERSTDDKWRFLAGLLLEDEKIFSQFLIMSSPKKKRGRNRASEDTKKYTPERLVRLANEFDRFYDELCQEYISKDVSMPTQKRAIEKFKVQKISSLPWLPQSAATIEKLIIQGRGMRDWPEVTIDDKPRILHPLQHEALIIIDRLSFGIEGSKSEAINSVVSLQFDRPGDIEKMRNLITIYRMKEYSLSMMRPMGDCQLNLVKRTKFSTKN